MSGITLHKKYGVNPTMDRCFFCLEHNNIYLVGSHTQQFKDAGLARPDGEMNMDIGVVDMEPCSKCEGYMKQGIILISIREPSASELDYKGNLKGKIPNPYRTGGWVVVNEDAIKRMINSDAMIEYALKTRWMFIIDQVWDMLGLPRGEVKNDKG